MIPTNDSNNTQDEGRQDIGVPLVNMEDPEIVKLAARQDASMRAVEEVCDSLGAALRSRRLQWYNKQIIRKNG